VSNISVLDFIENFYQLSIEEIGERLDAISSNYDQLRSFLALEDFAELHREQYSSGFDYGALGVKEPTPIFSRAGGHYNTHGQPGTPVSSSFMTVNRRGESFESIDPYAGMRSMFGAPTLYDGRELKSTLLYSEKMVIVDPFGVRRQLSQTEFRLLEQELGSEFLNPLGFSSMWEANRSTATRPLEGRVHEVAESIHLIRDLAPLIRSRVVEVVPLPSRDAVYWGDEDSLRVQLGGEIFARFPDSEPHRFWEAQFLSYLCLERAKDQLLGLAALGDSAIAFASGQIDVLAVELLVGELVRNNPHLASETTRWIDRSSEDDRLTELARLQLPGVDHVRAKDMVTIRDRDMFVVLRKDIREAINASSAEASVSVAATILREEMDVAMRRLPESGARSVLRNTTAGDVVAYAVGALTGWSIDGWRGAVAGLAAKGGYEVAGAKGQASRALRRHYLAIS